MGNLHGPRVVLLGNVLGDAVCTLIARADTACPSADDRYGYSSAVAEGSCGYAALWNAFKRIAAGYSAAEKAELFAGTAAKFYRLG